MLNNWSELGGLSARRSFACSWWICGIQCALQGERGNIVLSCVSVFTAHSLINYSAGPSDCDLQFWEETRVFPASDGSVTALASLIVPHFMLQPAHSYTVYLVKDTQSSLWNALMLFSCGGRALQILQLLSFIFLNESKWRGCLWNEQHGHFRQLCSFLVLL